MHSTAILLNLLIHQIGKEHNNKTQNLLFAITRIYLKFGPTDYKVRPKIRRTFTWNYFSFRVGVGVSVEHLSRFPSNGYLSIQSISKGRTTCIKKAQWTKLNIKRLSSLASRQKPQSTTYKHEPQSTTYNRQPKSTAQLQEKSTPPGNCKHLNTSTAPAQHSWAGEEDEETIVCPEK